MRQLKTQMSIADVRRLITPEIVLARLKAQQRRALAKGKIKRRVDSVDLRQYAVTRSKLVQRDLKRVRTESELTNVYSTFIETTKETGMDFVNAAWQGSRAATLRALKSA